jgi:diacylglycerol kinase (ATP)
MEAAGLSVDLRRPEKAASISGIIRGEGPGFDAVILGGGDGTVSHSLPALMEAGRPFGLLPMGTANDLARTLGIPFDPAEAAEIVIRGRTRRIDLATINDMPFVNVASIGLGVDIALAHEESGLLKRILGTLNYPISLVRAWNQHRPHRAVVVADGQSRRVRYIQIAVGNGRHYGGGLTISETADIDDGRLYAYILKPVAALTLMRLLPALRLGRLEKEAEVEFFTAKDIEVRTGRRRKVNVDGDVRGGTPARFGLLRGVLDVFARHSQAKVSTP